VKNQQAVISGILNKATSSPAILTRYSSILAALEDNLAISLSQKEMSALVKMQLDDMRGWDIETISLTGSGSYAETYSMPGMELYVMEPNQASIDAAKAAIVGVMSRNAE
jgi:anionic cell wall polymer biosynthesis LytR-Cps2A-Psr (LCP) family protein